MINSISNMEQKFCWCMVPISCYSFLRNLIPCNRGGRLLSGGAVGEVLVAIRGWLVHVSTIFSHLVGKKEHSTSTARQDLLRKRRKPGRR